MSAVNARAHRALSAVSGKRFTNLGLASSKSAEDGLGGKRGFQRLSQGFILKFEICKLGPSKQASADTCFKLGVSYYILFANVQSSSGSYMNSY